QYVSKRSPTLVMVCRREHEHSGSRIVFVIKPTDRIEVRKLPNKENGIQHPGFETESVCGRGPAHQNWRRAWECTGKCAESCLSLQRRVNEEVRDERQEAQQSSQRVEYQKYIEYSEERDRHSEDKCLTRC